VCVNKENKTVKNFQIYTKCAEIIQGVPMSFLTSHVQNKDVVNAR